MPATATATKNRDLGQARSAKNDEFYTQLPDIERECAYYERRFAGKVVLCNCDDPRVSNFFDYFSLNFERLRLKKLLTTCYKNQRVDMFSRHDSERAVWLEYNGDLNNNRVPDPEEIGIKTLRGDGDFRSEENIALLRQADIVVTNPPFSLFRQYVEQLMEYEKKFLIIGHLNALSYKEIFKLIKADKIWLGPSIRSGDREFGVPDHYPLRAAGFRVDEHGKKFIRVKGVRWFTNMDHNKRHEELPLFKRYSPAAYPKYDNYNAINVDKTKDIPADYPGVMGVPITFLDKYNPYQFDIIGQTHKGDDSAEVEELRTDPNNQHGGLVHGEKKYMRVLIRHKKGA